MAYYMRASITESVISLSPFYNCWNFIRCQQDNRYFLLIKQMIAYKIHITFSRMNFKHTRICYWNFKEIWLRKKSYIVPILATFTGLQIRVTLNTHYHNEHLWFDICIYLLFERNFFMLKLSIELNNDVST